MKWNHRRRVSVAWQADRESGEEGGRRKRKPKSQSKSPIPHPSFIPSIHFRRPHSHRHRHRPGHGVRRRGEQGRAHHVARLPRLGQAASGFRRRKGGRRCPSLARERIGPRGESRQSERRQSHRDARSVRQAGRLRPRDSQANRSRCWTWSTWWPAATAFPAGATGHRSDQRPGRRYADRQERKTTSSATESIIASRRCRLWTACSFPTVVRGPVQVDSAGHTFADFPATANRPSGYIWAGGAIPADQPAVIFEAAASVEQSWAASTTPRPVTACCSCTPTRESPSIWRRSGGQIPAASWCVSAPWRANGNGLRARHGRCMPTSGCWSMAKCVFDAERSVARNGAFRWDSDSPRRTGFLTLAATDGGNGIDSDWIMFGDPRLELAPVKERTKVPTRRFLPSFQQRKNHHEDMTKYAGNPVRSPANIRGGSQPPQDVVDDEKSSRPSATCHRSV